MEIHDAGSTRSLASIHDLEDNRGISKSSEHLCESWRRRKQGQIVRIRIESQIVRSPSENYRPRILSNTRLGDRETDHTLSSVRNSKQWKASPSLGYRIWRRILPKTVTGEIHDLYYKLNLGIPELLKDFVAATGRCWVGGKYRWFMLSGVMTALYLYLLQCSNLPQVNAVKGVKKEFEEAVKNEGLVNDYVARPIRSRKVCVFERCVKDIFLKKLSECLNPCQLDWQVSENILQTQFRFSQNRKTLSFLQRSHIAE